MIKIPPIFYRFRRFLPNSGKNLHALLKNYKTYGIPYISVKELQLNKENFILLDTRKEVEYNVSHIPGARWVGADFEADKMDSLKLKKSRLIIVYCTVGVRSAYYGNSLKKAGYSNVKNLHGSIFAWKNAGIPVIDLKDRETEKVHVYSKNWGKYLKNGEKIY